ncbi:MAG: glycosyltransferase family 4 protein [Hyphomicrobium sp.]
MKILYVITRAELGGGQTHLVELMRGFRDRADIELACGDTGYLTDEAAKLGIKCHVLTGLVQPMQPRDDLRALWNCYRLIRKIRPDIVHAHTSKAGFIARLAATAARVPSVFTAHTWCFTEGTSRKWKLIGVPLERLAGRISSKILTVSGSNRTLALRNRICSPDKLVTIYNGIGDTPSSAEHGRNAVPRIVMVARFSEQKDQATLVDAVRGLDMPFQLMFVGDGPLRQSIEDQVHRSELDAKVSFAGQRLDIAEILASSDIFVLASHWEGFPISILEAMRAGLPVVASKVDGVGEAVVDGVTGYLTPEGDSDALRDALARLVLDPSLRKRMGSAGRQHFMEEFTASAMLQKTGAVYEEVSRPHKLRPKVRDERLLARRTAS